MISGIGVAVVMFPILRRESERLALGYVASRIVESTMICVGLISLLSVLTLRGDLAASIGGNGGSLVIAGRTLVAIHDWTFLVGPGFCVGVNDILLGYLMYSTGLMPPRLAMFGLIGGPLIFASSIARSVRRLRPNQLNSRHPHDSGVHLRGLVCDLPDRQGVQAVPGPLRRTSNIGQDPMPGSARLFLCVNALHQEQRSLPKST